MVGGKKQLPIRGIGDIILEVVDSEGTTRQLEFCDVLFVPDMKFNLLSFAQVLKMGIQLVFSRTRCTFFVSKDYKLQVELAADMDLFQLRAKTPPKKPPNALMVSDSADDNPVNALVT
ncbi:uncharacterized protein PITG_21264 [Phytophthora infestans T30-4]|uniref:Retrovirus-related Pol polyprotein from transposon TNT 1-94-like beta-barrel domain-containing protein n=1 Tax=Phytophthora infestans (strain T30-4) TaxID=403677 RepID=D0P3Q1_PHYIT|nr:uncharacterized protein PITG_21264 [Phytophthora infestans T30-4]EEY60492.1 hypothetical protein PITG_21264 [Phytophthora infestans T30-4]|eukprot:XP_002895073.1 hypothetical protein PITG_21264 [Phytophthora infestans T30-4]